MEIVSCFTGGKAKSNDVPWITAVLRCATFNQSGVKWFKVFCLFFISILPFVIVLRFFLLLLFSSLLFCIHHQWGTYLNYIHCVFRSNENWSIKNVLFYIFARCVSFSFSSHFKSFRCGWPYHHIVSVIVLTVDPQIFWLKTMKLKWIHDFIQKITFRWCSKRKSLRLIQWLWRVSLDLCLSILRAHTQKKTQRSKTMNADLQLNLRKFLLFDYLIIIFFYFENKLICGFLLKFTLDKRYICIRHKSKQ